MTAMTTHRYTLTEYDASQPWVILSTSRSSVELPEGDSFSDWAREQWPDRKRWKVDEERDGPTPFSQLRTG